MYNIPYFKTDDREELLQFVFEHPLAFLSGSFSNGKPVATQIPMLLEDRGGSLYLSGHIMRNTDHHKAFHENQQVLAVFTGPNAYVSASWYSNPHMGSTWNYMSVHMRGTLQFLDRDGLISIMKRTTLRFENGDENSPTIFDNLSENYHAKMLPAIEAIEVKVDSFEHVFKLSQNRDEASYINIIEKLENKGGENALVALEMKKRRNKLFPPGAQWDESRFDS